MENEGKREKGMQLLKKGKRGIVRALFSRLGLIMALLIFQLFALLGIFQWFESVLPHVIGGTALYTLVMVLYLLNSRLDPTAKARCFPP